MTSYLYDGTAAYITKTGVDNILAKMLKLNSSGTFLKTHSTIDQMSNGSTSAVTITIASPGVVSWSTHGLSDGAIVILTTTGALPTGLTAGTAYYVVNSTANDFELSATSGGAAINTSGSQSGTHTAFAIGSYEVSGNGWAAGGETLSNFAVSTVTTNDMLVDADDIEKTASGGAIEGDNAVLFDALTGRVLVHTAYGGTISAGETTDFKHRFPNGILAGNYSAI